MCILTNLDPELSGGKNLSNSNCYTYGFQTGFCYSGFRYLLNELAISLMLISLYAGDFRKESKFCDIFEFFHTQA